MSHSIIRPLVASLLVVLTFGGCVNGRQGTGFTPTPDQSHLVDLLVARLDLARQVAWVKFQNNLPVRDPKREEELLAALISQSEEAGLPAARSRSFFENQINASCQLQMELIHGWTRGATLPALAPWDLRKHIRPRLDKISSEMVVRLSRLQKHLPNAAFASYARTVLRQRGFSWRVANIAVASLK